MSYPEQEAQQAAESKIAAQHARARAILAEAEAEPISQSPEPSQSDPETSPALQEGTANSRSGSQLESGRQDTGSRSSARGSRPTPEDGGTSDSNETGLEPLGNAAQTERS